VKDNKPDWTTPFGITTPHDRIGASAAKQAGGYPADDEPPAHETVNAGKRSESDGNPTIWSAYEEGF
jgi:hypothetical protein